MRPAASARALRDAGIEVWLDQSELRGGDAAGMPRSGSRSRPAPCSCRSSRRIRVLAPKGISGSNGSLRSTARTLMAAERAFLLPIVIDDTRDADALVPDKFREVQWTYLLAGRFRANFVERVARLLSPDDRTRARRIGGASRHPRQRPAINGAAGGASIAAIGFGGRTAVRECDERLRDRVPERRNLGVPHQQALEPQLGCVSFRERPPSPSRARRWNRRRSADVLAWTPSSSAASPSAGPSLSITAELVSVGDATQLWGEKYARQADDMMQVEGEIAATIARTLRRQLSGEREGQARPRRDRRPGGLSPVPQGARLPRGQPAGRWTRASTTFSRPWPAGARLRAWPTPAWPRPTPRSGVSSARVDRADAGGKGAGRRDPRARNSIRTWRRPTPRSASSASTSSGTGRAQMTAFRRALELNRGSRRRTRGLRDVS